jgi:hypothetical protein
MSEKTKIIIGVGTGLVSLTLVILFLLLPLLRGNELEKQIQTYIIDDLTSYTIEQVTYGTPLGDIEMITKVDDNLVYVKKNVIIYNQEYYLEKINDGYNVYEMDLDDNWVVSFMTDSEFEAMSMDEDGIMDGITSVDASWFSHNADDTYTLDEDHLTDFFGDNVEDVVGLTVYFNEDEFVMEFLMYAGDLDPYTMEMIISQVGDTYISLPSVD